MECKRTENILRPFNKNTYRGRFRSLGEAGRGDSVCKEDAFGPFTFTSFLSLPPSLPPSPLSRPSPPLPHSLLLFTYLREILQVPFLLERPNTCCAERC